MVTLWGLKVLGVALLSSLAVFPMQCGESCWSETGSGPWNSGMSDIGGRSGECGMGWNYAWWVCPGASGDGGIPQPKGGMSHCSGWIGSLMCTFWNCCSSCHSGNSCVIVIS